MVQVQAVAPVPGSVRAPALGLAQDQAQEWENQNLQAYSRLRCYRIPPGEAGRESLGLWLAELSEPDGFGRGRNWFRPLRIYRRTGWESLEDELEFLSFCSPELALSMSESFSDLEEESLSLGSFRAGITS